MSEELTDYKLPCPACHHGTVQPSSRRFWPDLLPGLIGLKPFRCRRCSYRFFTRFKTNRTINETVNEIVEEEPNDPKH